MLHILKILFILISITFITSCKEQRKSPDVSNININLSFYRFENDLFQSDFEKLNDSIPSFTRKYGEFLEVFNHKIVQLGSTDNPAYPDLLKGFITDYMMNQIYKSVSTEFPNTNDLEEQLTIIFKHYKYYFPNKSIPTVITYISGFNQSIVTTDTLLGIGLDKYLGSKNDYYKRLGLPTFARANMFKEKIPTDCARAWAMTEFPMSDSSENLLSNIIYQGKIVYFTQMLSPKSNDTLLTGLSAKSIEWCKANESKMWTYLIENKMLFKSDYLTINKFIQDAPFTKDFGQNSPGRAVVWLGWQIVTNFMDKNPHFGLNELMAENDYQTILNKAKYRP
jgi:hypothetical protein